MDKKENTKLSIKQTIKICIITVISIIAVSLLISGVVILKQNLDKKKQIAAEEARLAAQIEVPNVIGMTYDEAEETIKNAELDYVIMPWKAPQTGDTVTRQNPSAGTKTDKGTKVEITIKAKETENEQKATEKNKAYDVGTTYTSFEEIESKASNTTKHILADIWSNYADIFPNAKWKEMEIKESDGYGRYWVRVKYVKNTSDTYYSTDHIIAWYIDNSHYGMFATAGDINMKKQQAKWGTTLDIDN